MPSPDEKLYLAIDAGPEATFAVLTDAEGAPVGSATAPPLPASPTDARFRDALAGVADKAVQGASVKLNSVSVVGVSVPNAADRFRTLASSAFQHAPVVIETRASAALRGAGAGQEGIALLADSGAVASGRSDAGQEASAGGWNTPGGDEGSAVWIGQEALRAAFRAHDGRSAPGPLLASVPARFGARDVLDLHRILNSDPASLALSSVVADVDAAAAEGDSAAMGILHHASLHLANMAAAVYRKLWEGESVACYAIGPVFESEYLVSELEQWLTRLAPGITLEQPLAQPVVGALLLAFDTMGLGPVDLDWTALAGIGR